MNKLLRISYWNFMDNLVGNFNQIFPDCASTKFIGGCSIKEPDNINTNKFQEIKLNSFDGFQFPHDLAGKTSSFPQIANHNGVLLKDCDGIVLFEKGGQKYILFCELKSSYILEDIAKAKDQLVGSFVKFKGLLSCIQGYKQDDYKPIGIIVSFEPTQEQLTNISKKLGTDRRSSFALTLNSKRFYSMPADKCNHYFCPLAVGNFDIYYIAVPSRKTSFSIDINSIIK